MPLSARIASSAVDRFGFAVARQRGDELRPAADETRVREVEDRPEVAEAVLDRRAGERDARARVHACAAAATVSLAGFLIACASSSTTFAHSISVSASMSRTAVP